ncbi:MAG: tetratricopeptide repeat protein [Chitinophagaceae bacterium]
MIDNINNEELIEQYLLGEMTGARLEEFKLKLLTDDQFRNKVSMQKAIIQNVKIEGRIAWKLKLEAYHKELDTSLMKAEQTKMRAGIFQKFTRFPIKRYFQPVAATVALVIITTVTFLSVNSSSATDRIFSEYYHPFSSVVQASRELPNNSPSQKDQAFDAYNREQYSESIKMFTNILSYGSDETAIFYLGNAYLSTGKYKEAEITFTRYLNEYKEFAVESTWYLALSYLKQKKTKEARPLFEQLSIGDNDYRKKAQDILIKL